MRREDVVWVCPATLPLLQVVEHTIPHAYEARSASDASTLGSSAQASMGTVRVALRGIVDLLSTRLFGDGVAPRDAPHRRSLGPGSTPSTAIGTHRYSALQHTVTGPANVSYAAKPHGDNGRDVLGGFGSRWMYTRRLITGYDHWDMSPDAMHHDGNLRSGLRREVTSHAVVSFGGAATLPRRPRLTGTCCVCRCELRYACRCVPAALYGKGTDTLGPRCGLPLVQCTWALHP